MFLYCSSYPRFHMIINPLETFHIFLQEMGKFYKIFDKKKRNLANIEQCIREIEKEKCFFEILGFRHLLILLLILGNYILFHRFINVAILLLNSQQWEMYVIFYYRANKKIIVRETWERSSSVADEITCDWTAHFLGFAHRMLPEHRKRNVAATLYLWHLNKNNTTL